MMEGTKYFKLFDTEPNYETYIDGDEVYLPNVSLTLDDDVVHYNPKNPANEYLTFEVLSNGNICQGLGGGGGDEPIMMLGKRKTNNGDLILGAGNNEAYIEYSTDNGETWQEMPSSLSVTSGDIILLRGNATLREFINNGGGGGDVIKGGTRGASGHFSFEGTSCAFNLRGNIMSIVGGENFRGLASMADATFENLFESLEVIDASKLVLPATTLSEGCYQGMFSGCYAMTKAPAILPAMTLANRCYNSMFSSCGNLTATPTLPATTLATLCYTYMFSYCTSLTHVSSLPATALTESCYSNMFVGCSSLTVAPALPATSLATYCYEQMFADSGLITAPELPATELAYGCYLYMFSSCSNLTTPMATLPATTLEGACYYQMFTYCTNLTTAPEIMATRLINGGGGMGDCGGMFQGCSSLNYVKCLATSVRQECCKNWLSGVAENGTFVKSSSMFDWPSGVNGIPSTWTRQNA
jgi:hypothetical protein